MQNARNEVASEQLPARCQFNRSRLAQTGRDVFPVHQVVEEVGEINRALVPEVDVVGMLPHITAQKLSLIHI